MKARPTIHVHLSDAETGELFATAQRIPDREDEPPGRIAVYINGVTLTFYGTADQLHRLAADISNAVNALDDPEAGDR